MPCFGLSYRDFYNIFMSSNPIDLTAITQNVATLAAPVVQRITFERYHRKSSGANYKQASEKLTKLVER